MFRRAAEWHLFEACLTGDKTDTERLRLRLRQTDNERRCDKCATLPVALAGAHLCLAGTPGTVSHQVSADQVYMPISIWQVRCTAHSPLATVRRLTTDVARRNAPALLTDTTLHYFRWQVGLICGPNRGAVRAVLARQTFGKHMLRAYFAVLVSFRFGPLGTAVIILY